MHQFICPSCGAAVVFQTSVSVSAVCSYCRSVVVRHDKNVELMGTVAELTPDVSPFQIGTTGRHRNVGFSLIGRLKMSWSAGMWNEWFLTSDDGRMGWLAEAQGFLSIAYETDDLPEARLMNKLARLLKLSSFDASDINPQPGTTTASLELGSLFKIGDKTYQLMDFKDAVCTGCEGELPVVAMVGRKTTTIDFLSESGAFASIELGQSVARKTYVGEYVEFDSLSLRNIRELPGWPVPRQSSAKAVTRG